MRTKKHSFLKVVLIICMAFLLILLTSILYIKFGIKKEIDLSLLKPGTSTVTKIYSFDRKNGIFNIDSAEELIEERIFTENSEWCSINDIPENLKNAFIAVEDHKFYDHKGVNWPRTIKATLNYISNLGKVSFGASTITQQLIKNLTGDDMLTPKRKIEEIFRAQNLEKKLSKNEILELYLNVVYLSQNCYGIQSASNLYFGKNAEELTLEECASLASIVKNPSKYDPYKFPENNKSRRKIVLKEMLEQKMISQTEYNDAMNTDLAINSNIDKQRSSGIYSWFVEKLISDIKTDLMKEYNLNEEGALMMINRGGLKIYSTIDTNAQKAVDEVFQNYISFLKPQNGKYPEASCVVLDPNTSDILAIAGGVGVKSANRIFNRATDAKRPLGSVIKPLSVYAPGIEMKSFTYGTSFEDLPILNGESFWPHNANNRYMGLVSLNYGLEHSLNTVSVRALNMLGLENSFNFCKDRFKINLVDDDKNQAPLALGQLTQGDTLLNVTSSYATFANGGTISTPRSYYYVTDSNGNVILKKEYHGERIISEDCASIMNIMLRNVAINGTAKNLTITKKFDIAAKTGTSGENKDKWIIGYSPYYVCGVWVGYDTPITMNHAGNYAIEMFDNVMNRAHFNKEQDMFLFNSGNLIKTQFCVDSGLAPTNACEMDLRLNRVQTGYFIKGTEPKWECNLHKEVNIDSRTGLIANDGLSSLLKRKISLLDYNRESIFKQFEPYDEKYFILSRIA